MPKTLTLGVTPVAVGQQQFEIDQLPNNSDGVIITFGVSQSWIDAEGPLFSLDLLIALDGVNYQQWIRVDYVGGQPVDRSGPISAVRVVGKWPGENDGAGGRRKLRAASLRAVLTVHQAFSFQSVDARTF
jgi:hypothetical protein